MASEQKQRRHNKFDNHIMTGKTEEEGKVDDRTWLPKQVN